MLESEPRDSTAAIGLAAAILERREPGVVIGSFAADHVISNPERFRAAVVQAVAVREERLVGRLVLAAGVPVVPTLANKPAM